MSRRVQTDTLFDVSVPLPDGLLYRPEFVSRDEEQALLAHVRLLPFGEVRMHGVAARRRIVQYGHRYSFDSTRISAGTEIPDFLRPLRTRVAAAADVMPDEFSEVLVTEYPPGAPIGWHRDAPPFGIVAGVSLLSACRFQMRRHDRTGDTITLEVEPRSLYVLRGPARSDWQHHIPPASSLRYSITMRTLRGSRRTL